MKRPLHLRSVELVLEGVGRAWCNDRDVRIKALGWLNVLRSRCDARNRCCAFATDVLHKYTHMFKHNIKSSAIKRNRAEGNASRWCHLTQRFMERGSSVGRMPDSQSREPGFEPRCYRFEVWAFSFTSRRLSRLSCINEYLAIDSGGNVSE